MPDKPTQNPSDPDNPNPGSSKSEKSEKASAKKLRLKRVVIQDTEIKPGTDKDWEPAPESQPFEEPEEEPVPIQPIPLTPEQIGELPQENTPAAPEDDDEELDEEEEEPQEKATLSPAARLSIILVPAALVCGILIFLLKTFDPFGGDLQRIAPTQIPTGLLKKEAKPEGEDKAAQDGLAATSLETGRTSLQEFISALQEQPLTASANPRGVFIDSVFIPEGAALNKQIGVVFSNLLIEGNKALVVITSPDGTKLTLPADVNIR